MALVTKGILGRKLGMTQIFDDAARAIPVTIVQAGPCRVAQVKTPDRDGYSAVQLAFSEAKATRVNKPLSGHFAKAKIAPHQHLVEIRVADSSGYSVGQELKADIFEAGERADVTGRTKGKGFTGVMKRHNFHGAPASHGTERKHRVPGAVGAGSTPARVFRGQKMPGRLGNDRVTVLGLEVVRVDPEQHLLLLRGAVPGPNGGLLLVRASVRGGVPQ